MVMGTYIVLILQGGSLCVCVLCCSNDGDDIIFAKSVMEYLMVHYLVLSLVL